MVKNEESITEFNKISKESDLVADIIAQTLVDNPARSSLDFLEVINTFLNCIRNKSLHYRILYILLHRID